jgi:hypothetical protein
VSCGITISISIVGLAYLLLKLYMSRINWFVYE